MRDRRADFTGGDNEIFLNNKFKLIDQIDLCPGSNLVSVLKWKDSSQLCGLNGVLNWVSAFGWDQPLSLYSVLG